MLRSVLWFIIIIAIAWAYIHVGFMVIDQVETKLWRDMSLEERALILTGCVFIFSSFWVGSKLIDIAVRP